MQAALSNEINTRTGKSKVEQYRWELKDKPGELVWLAKETLHIDHSYQRKAKPQRVLALASRWSWVACGTITVAKRREDQRFYVVEGQHRVLAALKRADIKELPCIVFETEGAMQEAGGFFDANTNRRMPTSLEKWNAQLLRGDKNTVFVNELITKAGRKAGQTTGASDVRCLTAMLRAAESNRDELLRVWPLMAEVCAGKTLHERLFDGLMWLEVNMPEGESLSDRRWRERVLRVGHQGLLDAAQRAAAFYARGGAKVWALGMLEALNKGCRIHLQLRAEG